MVLKIRVYICKENALEYHVKITTMSLALLMYQTP